MILRPTARVWCVAMLALPLVAACGSDEKTSSGAPEVSEFPVVTQDAALPLESYVLSLSERAELKSMYQELLTRCARRFGGQPLVVQPGTEELVEESRMWGGRFGTMTAEHASTLGYHAGPGDPVVPSFGLFANDGEEPLATILYGADRKVPGEEASAARADVPGLPQGGCAGEVDKLLGGDPFSTIPEDIDKLRLAAYRDDRTQEAVRDWADCMAEAGFRYTSVDEPVDTFGDGRALSEEELAVATADVACTKSSRWRDISFAIEKAYQERELKENPERWADVKAKGDSIYANARKAVAEGPR